MEEEINLFHKLESLREQHKTLDEAIDGCNGSTGEFEKARLKKERLKIRDEILVLESELYPNITA